MRMMVESCIPLGNVLRLGGRNFAEEAAVEFLRFTNQETFNKFKTILKASAGHPVSPSSRWSVQRTKNSSEWWRPTTNFLSCSTSVGAMYIRIGCCLTATRPLVWPALFCFVEDVLSSERGSIRVTKCSDDTSLGNSLFYKNNILFYSWNTKPGIYEISTYLPYFNERKNFHVK